MPRNYQVHPGKSVNSNWSLTISDGATPQSDIVALDERNTFPIVIPSDKAGLTDGATTLWIPSGGGTNYTKSISNLASPAPTDFSAATRGTGFIVFGTSYDSGSSAYYDDLLNRPAAARRYDGGGLSTWTGNAWAQDTQANRPWVKRIYWSFKGGSTNALTGFQDWNQAEVTAAINAFPASPSDRELVLIWYHEPEQPWNSAAQQAEFKRRFGLFCDFVHSFGRANVKTGLVLTGFAYSPLPGAAGTFWTKYYPGDGKVDILCSDSYWNHNDRGQPDGNGALHPYGNFPTRKFGDSYNAFLQTDCESLAFTETGWTLDPVNDPTGAIRDQAVKEGMEWWYDHAHVISDILWWDKDAGSFNSRVTLSAGALARYADACVYSRQRLGV